MPIRATTLLCSSAGRAMRGVSGAPAMEALEARTLLSLAFVDGPTRPNAPATPAVLADFNGDGKVDMASSSGQAAGMLSVFLGDGNGGFGAPTNYDYGFAVPGNFPALIRTLDMDHDGDQDIITNGPGLWINQGNGTFAAGTTIPFAIVARDLQVFNYDGDNFPDLVIVEPAGTLKVLVNTSGVNFGSGPQFLIETGSILLTPGKVDTADTRQDILYWTPSDQRVRTILNLATGLDAGRDVGGVQTQPLSADLNGDGYMDLVWGEGNGSSSNVMGAFNDGNSRWATNRSLRSPDSGTGWTDAVALADFDGDTKLDLLMRSDENAGSVHNIGRFVLRGDGAGHFDGLTIAAHPAIGDGTAAQLGTVLAGDISRDGRADITRWVGNAPGTTTGTISTRLSAAGPVMAALTGPSGNVLPGRVTTLTASGLLAQTGDPIQRVRFYQDSNQNGRYDTGDLEVSPASAPPPSGTEARSYTLADGGPTGNTKYFAIAFAQSGGVSDVKEATLNLWTRQYFPEGWRNIANVNEHIPMANINSFSVDYQILLHYELDDVPQVHQVFETGTIPPNTRWGATTALRGNTTINVAPDHAYAIEVLSSAPIAAQLARYDTFSVASGQGGQGESFTNRSGTRFGFTNVTNQSGTLDFMLFFNPIEGTVANVTIDFYRAGSTTPTTITRTVNGLRRSGVAVAETVLPPNSVFDVVVTSDSPIIASESRYTPSQQKGMATLGQELTGAPLSGPTEVAIPGIEIRSGVSSPAVFFNPGDTSISVTLTGLYSGTPDATSQSFILAPKARQTVVLTNGAPTGATAATFRVSATGAILVGTETFDSVRGDAVSTNGATFASRQWGFGDGYLDPLHLGTQFFAGITLYNPQATGASVTLRFLFDPDEAVRTVSVSLNANETAFIRLDQTPELAGKPRLDWYSTHIVSDQAIVASMTHWDLTQPGGWTTIGTPLDSVSALPGPGTGG